jgi:hypothetical protein
MNLEKTEVNKLLIITCIAPAYKYASTLFAKKEKVCIDTIFVDKVNPVHVS